MLERLKVLSARNMDFAFETTLAARSFAKFLKQCKRNGYKINLFYVWLNSQGLAVARVSRRVASGGHDIPIDIITRRYERGKKNFVKLYSPIADRWIAYDNSNQRQKIAEKPLNQAVTIYQPRIWQQIITD